MNENQIEMVDINQLMVHPDNALYIDSDLSLLTESIKTNGLLEPLVVSSITNRLLSGHRRFAALKVIGEKQVPVRFLNVTTDEEKLCLISFNMYRNKNLREKIGEVALIREVLNRNKTNRNDVFKRFRLETGENMDTRQVLCSIVGYSETYLSRLERINEANSELINLIDQDELSINKAYLMVTKGKEKAPTAKTKKNEYFCAECPHNKLVA